MDETASRLMQEGAVRDFIVVAVPNAGPDRHIEYFPQKPFEAMDPEQQAEFYALGRTDSAKLFNGPIRSDAYLRFQYGWPDINLRHQRVSGRVRRCRLYVNALAWHIFTRKQSLSGTDA